MAMQVDGSTPLYLASLNGHMEAVRVLLGAGAAVNQAKVRVYVGAREWDGVHVS